MLHLSIRSDDPGGFPAINCALADNDLFGACDESLEVRIPTDLKDAIRRAATARGMRTAPWVRLVLANAALGQEHVLSVLAQHVTIAPGAATNSAPAHARTDIQQD